MNEKVVRDTKYRTTKDRIYAKAWNVCNNYWVNTIDNAPTVPLPDFKEGYKQAIIDGKTNFSRPQGEWIESCKISSSEYFRNKENFIESKCSNCNRWSLRLDFQMEEKFCPLCGAKMKGGEKEE